MRCHPSEGTEIVLKTGERWERNHKRSAQAKLSRSELGSETVRPLTFERRANSSVADTEMKSRLIKLSVRAGAWSGDLAGTTVRWPQCGQLSEPFAGVDCDLLDLSQHA